MGDWVYEGDGIWCEHRTLDEKYHTYATVGPKPTHKEIRDFNAARRKSTAMTESDSRFIKLMSYVEWKKSRFKKFLHDLAFRLHWRSTYKNHGFRKLNIFQKFWYRILWRIKTYCAPKHCLDVFSPIDKIALGILLGQVRNDPYG